VSDGNPGQSGAVCAQRRDWQLLVRRAPADADAGGFDVAFGGGFDLPPGMVARELARMDCITVASPAFLQGKPRPTDPAGLADLASIVTCSSLSGRLRTHVMRNSAGVEMMIGHKPSAAGPGFRPSVRAARAAAPAKRCAAAAVTRLVWRHWPHLAVLRQPETAARQDPRLRRFRHPDLSRAAAVGV